MDFAHLEFFITVVISAITNYIFLRERLLVLETKFLHTRQLVEELYQTVKKLEHHVIRISEQIASLHGQ